MNIGDGGLPRMAADRRMWPTNHPTVQSAAMDQGDAQPKDEAKPEVLDYETLHRRSRIASLLLWGVLLSVLHFVALAAVFCGWMNGSSLCELLMPVLNLPAILYALLLRPFGIPPRAPDLPLPLYGIAQSVIYGSALAFAIQWLKRRRMRRMYGQRGRMKRRIFNIVSGLSLLLCVATTMMWLRSHLASDVLKSVQPSGFGYRSWALSSGEGRCGWSRECQQFIGSTAAKDWGEWKSNFRQKDGFGLVRRASSPDSLFPSGTFGFHFGHYSEFEPNPPYGPPHSLSVIKLIVPYWLPTLMTSLLPLWWATSHARWLEAARRRSGLCLTCGYDLRASYERCPECGTPIANAPKATAN
ncbi:MAG TPA: hypothetical protein VHP11_04910 [Tepidisphaeraceae bacterium]|nr:hypothetical protein [Tepidisphaeraceae bacterium]